MAIPLHCLNSKGYLMISSKNLLITTGISRATLNNYITLGLLSRPLVMNPGREGGGARQLGFFPDETLARVEAINKLKREGLSMAEIVANIGSRTVSSKLEAVPPPLPATLPSSGLRLTVDDIAHPAYMVNYNFELVWFNDHAREQVFDGLDDLPASSEERGLFRLIAARASDAGKTELLRLYVGLAKGRLSADCFAKLCQGLPSPQFANLQRYYAEAPDSASEPIINVPLILAGGERQNVFVSFFREGLFIVHVPDGSNPESMLDFLARRDEVIRGLLRRRLPVLTHLAVLVADLQGSMKICSELPAEEYFELINEIWAATGPIFRKYCATYGKHVGDGMVYYFFPQPDSNYLMNVLLCSQEIKQEMQKISKSWQIRKQWLNELYLNTGITEGQEWLGTFQSATSVEFVVLGDTINQAARISDFARHGTIWVSKSLIGKLPGEERERVSFGVRRKTPDGREINIPSSFALVSSLADISSSEHKLNDIATLPITEVTEIAGS